MDTQNRKDVIGFAAQLLANPDTVFLKVETTGVNEGAQVVEIAVVHALTGDVLLNSLVKPSRPYRMHEKLLHGITYESLADAPAITAVHLDTLLYRKHIVSYAGDFAPRLIRQSYAAHNIFFQPEATWHDARAMYGAYEGVMDDWGRGWKWWTFDDACENLHVNNTQRNHRALEEAKTIGLLLWQIAYRGDAQTAKRDALPAPISQIETDLHDTARDADAQILQDPWGDS